MIQQRNMLFLFLYLCIAINIGCGEDDPSSKPIISDPQINCGDPPADSFADGQVIREFSVKVDDVDRDLLEVTANLNGYQIQALTDDDADQRFNWTPDANLDPMVCKGQISVQIQAKDAQGNITVLSDVIIK